MIYVTHDQTEALTFADKVVVMHEGRVVQMGTPEEQIFVDPSERDDLPDVIDDFDLDYYTKLFKVRTIAINVQIDFQTCSL